MANILIIEDEVLLADIVQEKLLDSGIESNTAASYQAALEKLKANNYDCIILDINLGAEENGGAQLLREIAAGANRYTPIIICSGHVSPGFKMDFGASIIEIFSKPFPMHELIEKVESIIANSSANLRKIV